MRILAGQYKNREIKTPKGEKTRPTSSKVRGSVFDILQNHIENASFLDLFAGSGAMGLEALSRGAASSTFIEVDRAAADCIRKNLSHLGLSQNLFQQEASTAIKRLIKMGSTFDIIYIDPPYAMEITPFLETLSPLLAKEGILLLEQSKRATVSPKTLTLYDQRHFGDTTLLFFHRTK